VVDCPDHSDESLEHCDVRKLGKNKN